MRLIRELREGVPIITRFLWSWDLDRFERETREFRAKYGIGR